MQGDTVNGERARRRDPRYYQIAVLSGLLVYGTFLLGFELSVGKLVAILGSTLLAQIACSSLVGVSIDLRSPLISGLSLLLLARSGSLWLLALTGIAAIGSKFLIRSRGKHVFNPTNFGLVSMALLSGGQVWISPGQWGSGATLAFFFAAAGMLVVHRAARSDVTWAFLAAYASVLFLRAWWLGDPWSIPLHSLNSGSLLLFAFFMISDPKTTPDSRAGRLLFACLVAGGAGFVHFGLFRSNGFVWSLAVLAPCVPILDRWLSGERSHWLRLPAPPPFSARPNSTKEIPAMSNSFSVSSVSRLGLIVALSAAGLVVSTSARAFCGFYVAKADTKLFNKASQVVLARDSDRTVLTMANDFKGDPREFAVVIPVPTFIERGQIHVADQVLIDHLDAYTSPRLVEYFDSNPCRQVERRIDKFSVLQSAVPARGQPEQEKSNLGVRIEAKYTVGEYDILILSAEESSGLETWLRRNGYRVPEGAGRILGSYLRQGMRFFVAKVNLDERAALGFQNLRPLQIAYESPKFMLPIRLGMLNAEGMQEIFVYALTRRGRVETTNYRTVRLPSGQDIPVFVKADFGAFYRDMFGRQVERNGMSSVFLEYAWDMAWCDPCAADPLNVTQLRELGVFWTPQRRVAGPAQDVFVTRLHVRYDGEHFPEDLVFQQTGDRTNFQGRYILHHPWTGLDSCPAAQEYHASLGPRFEREAQTLASLTGWSLEDIRRRMDPGGTGPFFEPEPWWRRLWSDR